MPALVRTFTAATTMFSISKKDGGFVGDAADSSSCDTSGKGKGGSVSADRSGGGVFGGLLGGGRSGR